MYRIFAALVGTLAVTVLCVRAQESLVPPLGPPYDIEFDPRNDLAQYSRHEGRESMFITVRYAIVHKGPVPPGVVYKVIIEEEGVKRFELDVPKPKTTIAREELALVLSMDTSGSMSKFGRMEQTRQAASTFLGALPRQADAGLIFFNHLVYHRVPPPAERGKLLGDILKAQAKGGTAYLDAAADAVGMLRPFGNKQRAVILITDGIDLNSDHTQDMVIAKAKQAGVRVYTIGIGKRGELRPVSSILVLDRSGSMTLPVNDREKVTKIEALKNAAARFAHGISTPRRCAVLDFGDAPSPATPFTSQRDQLKNLIKALQAKGETCLFDAVYEGIATLEADNHVGKRAIVALTDGIDNRSRRRAEEVIAYAQATNTPLFVLGFGRAGELDIPVMEAMAKKTGGLFFHADNQEKLIEYFESVATHIHDDGIDEVALRKLALDTGGRYYPAEEVKDLKFILEREVADELGKQKETVTKTFESIRPVADGVPRRVRVYLDRLTTRVIDVGGKKVDITERETVQTYEGSLSTQGLVIAEMSPFVSLGLLAVLGALIALPALLRRRARV